MAQVVRLKRTSVEGRKPTTSNLELGELAINTHDGKIFFEKNDGSPSIKEIATEDSFYFYTTSLDSRYVNLTGNETIAGNKTFSNNITISGNLSVAGTTTTIDSTTVNIGDNILELNYGGSATRSGLLVKDATASSVVSGSFLWNATTDRWIAGISGSESNVLLALGDSVFTSSAQISGITNTQLAGSIANAKLANSAITISGTSLSLGGTITDETLFGGTGLISSSQQLPGGIVSGSSQLTSTFLEINGDSVLSGSNLEGMTVSGSFSGSFQGDGSNLTGVTAEISTVATVTDTFTNTTSKTVTHDFNTKDVIVSVYDDSDGYFIPSTIVTTDANTVTVTFATAESGRVVVAKGGHLVNGLGTSEDSQLLDGENAAFYRNFNNLTNKPSGLVSGSAQVTGIGNGQLSNSAVTISGTSVSLGGAITDETLFGGVGVVTGSAQIDHDSTTNFVANEHIDHSSVSITAGTGLNGGGTIASTRTLNVDDDYKNTSLNSATSSYQPKPSEGAFADGDKTKLDAIEASADVTDTANVKSALNANLTSLTIGDSNDTITIPGNLTVNGATTYISSSNLNIGDNILELNYAGTAADAGILVKDAVSTGTSGSLLWDASEDYWIAGALGSEDIIVLATATQTLTNKTINGSQLVNSSVANTKLANSAITISGTSVSLGGAITDETLFGGVGVISGSSQVSLETVTGGSGIQSGSILNADLAGSIANSKLSNSAVTISGTSVSLGGSITDETLFGGTGVVSGSSQVTDLTTHKETVSGASSYAVDHNLGEQYPIVQCWNTATSKQELPNSVTTNSTNRVTVDFSTTFAGIIIVKK
jgi:hypothetical protein